MKLAHGLHERLLTHRLAAAADALAPARAERAAIDDADLSEYIARHLKPHLASALAALPDESSRLALTERLLTVIASAVPDLGLEDEAIAAPAR